MRSVLPTAVLCLALAGAAAPASALETVVVTASPLQPASDDAASGHVQSLTAADLDQFGAADLLGAVSRQLSGVSLADAQGNRFQSDLSYRGFAASPLVGSAQGLAVYVDGVRFNQPFGDNVEWSLIPDLAVARVSLESPNPAFGLNALAGSLSVSLKNGFDAGGLEAEVEGGSFGHGEAAVEAGGEEGGAAAYAAVSLVHDDGWRQDSPTSLARAFASLAWRGPDFDLRLDAIGAANDLTGDGTTPIELLAVKRNAVFTHPDETRNLFGLVTLNGSLRLADGFSLSGNVYADVLSRHTANADASDAAPCGAPDTGDLCLDDGALLRDSQGLPIADFLSGGPYAQLNLTRTATLAGGGALESRYRTGSLELLGGMSLDRGQTGFAASTRIGALTPDRGFGGPGTEIDQPDKLIAPVHVAADNTYYGLYAQAALDVGEALRLELSARYNLADISLKDRLGTALDGHHGYARFDPSLGAAYRLDEDLSASLRYAEANRAPTPAEFSCADSLAPCSLTNFFVGDPELRQIVARTLEAGLRGSRGAVSFQLDAWRTYVSDDILFFASPIPGRGFFQNFGATRREGIEADATWRDGRWTLVAAYSFTHATFRARARLDSPDNPLADASGAILVVPGDRLPGVPEHVFKLDAQFAATKEWTLSLAARGASGVFLVGDEANLTPPTAGYIVLDAAARFRVSPGIELYAGVDNLFDRKYETFGDFSPTAAVPIAQAPGASNPRSLSPGAPRTFTAGLRWRSAD